MFTRASEPPERAASSRDEPLAGQTLLVIGGSSGIGLEAARIAHSQGAAVILTARNPERVRRAGLELEGRIAAFDATDFPRLGRFFEELEPMGIDHVLVTVPRPQDVALPDFDQDIAHRDLDGHLLLPLRVAHEAAKKLAPGGTLVFIGCTGEWQATAGSALLPAIAAAQSAMTRSLASKLAPTRVNLIVASPFGSPSVELTGVAALAVRLMTDLAVTGATMTMRDVPGSWGVTTHGDADPRARRRSSAR